MNPFSSLFRAFRRVFVALGLAVEKATETAAIDAANIEAGIRAQRQRAQDANKANGVLQGQVILLKEQIRDEEMREQQILAELREAAARNDEVTGGSLAETLESIQNEIARNKEQLARNEELYQTNLNIIAAAIKETEKMEREFKNLQVREKIANMQKGTADLIASSIQELRGMGEMGEAMQRLRERAASGEGQATATLDLARKTGHNIQVDQKARQARGRALFETFKATGSLKHPEVNVPVQTKADEAPAATQEPPARQRVGEGS